MTVVKSSSEQAEWVKNSLGIGAATSTRVEQGLDRADAVLLLVGTGVGSTAGNHDNSTACCRQGCSRKITWLCVQWPQIAFSSFSFVGFETKSLPAKIKISN